jgi:hypothetical protein
MGWEVGFDKKQNRWVGYGVPCICEHPGCTKEIDRGLSYVCGGEPFGGDVGCGQYFCEDHLYIAHKKGDSILCQRCVEGKKPFPRKFEIRSWVEWILNDSSWEQWREENPTEVTRYKMMIETGCVS